MERYYDNQTLEEDTNISVIDEEIKVILKF